MLARKRSRGVIKMRNNGLDYDERMKLVEFKDNCYVNGRLNEERIKAYEEEIERCERLGYNVEVHKLVIGHLYQKIVCNN